MTKKIPVAVRIVQFVDILSGAIIIFFIYLMGMVRPLNQSLRSKNHSLTPSDSGSLVNFGFVLLILFCGMFLLWQAYYLKKLNKKGYVIQLIISILSFFLIVNSFGKVLQMGLIFLMLTRETRLAFGIGK